MIVEKPSGGEGRGSPASVDGIGARAVLSVGRSADDDVRLDGPFARR